MVELSNETKIGFGVKQLKGREFEFLRRKMLTIHEDLRRLADAINDSSSGATSVADGGTITHGFSAAPSSVRVTPSVAGEFVSVTAVGATTFTVAIKKHDNTAGTTQTIYWDASA